MVFLILANTTKIIIVFLILANATKIIMVFLILANTTKSIMVFLIVAIWHVVALSSAGNDVKLTI